MANYLENWGLTFGEEQYSQAFAAITKGSFEKTQSSMIAGDFLSRLKLSGLFSSAINIIDIGSGDGKNIAQILAHSEKLSDINIYAIDHRPGAVEIFNGIASLSSPDFTINSCRAAVGNAFSGHISVDLALPKHSGDVVIVSHLAYGVCRTELTALVDDISANLLRPNGVGIFLHVKDGSDSILDLRNRYGGNAEQDSTAGGDKIRDPSSEIARIADQNGDEIIELRYRTRTYFDKMSDAEWEVISDVRNHPELQRQHPHLVDNVLRIAFIPLRTPKAMGRSSYELSWAKLVAHVKLIVKNSSNGKNEYYLEDIISMQILLPKVNPAGVERHVARNIVQKITKDLFLYHRLICCTPPSETGGCGTGAVTSDVL